MSEEKECTCGEDNNQDPDKALPHKTWCPKAHDHTAVIERIAAHPDGPVKGVEIIVIDEQVGEPIVFLKNGVPMKKRRIHIGIEGTDLEFVFDMDPGYGEVSMLNDALLKAKVEIQSRGLSNAMKAIEGKKPDVTVVPPPGLVSLHGEKKIRQKYQNIIYDVLNLLDHEDSSKPLGGLTTIDVIPALKALQQARIDLVTKLCNLEARVQKCKEGHEYLADSHEYPCPRCNIASLERIVEKLHRIQPVYDNQIVTQGALNALVGQRDVAWRERYLDRAAVLGKLHRDCIDKDRDVIEGSAVRAMLKEEEGKIPPEPEFKGIIHAMAEKPDEFAGLVAGVLLWHAQADRDRPVPGGKLKRLGAWMRENGYEFEEYT